MKLKYKILLGGLALSIIVGALPMISTAAYASTNIDINESNFPDPEFRAYVEREFDTAADGVLSSDEITKANHMSLLGETKITDLTGIEHLTALKYLNAINTGITKIDVSNNLALQDLRLSYSGITSLDVSENSMLKNLNTSNTGITSLDVSNNHALEELYTSNTGITSLDVSKNPALKALSTSNTGITKLDLRNNTALETLTTLNTKLTEIDVTKNPALKLLFISYTGITSLDVSNNPELEELIVSNTSITELDVSENPALARLSASRIGITSLDVSKNPALLYLNVNECYLPDKAAVIGMEESKWDETDFIFGRQQEIYNVLEGNNQKIVVGTEKEIIFKVDGPYNEFFYLTLDGEMIQIENYKIEEGSIIITLNGDFVKTLAVGNYELVAGFALGSANMSFEVIQSPTPESTPTPESVPTQVPDTGDNTNVTLLLGLMMVSLAGVGVAIYRRKRVK